MAEGLFPFASGGNILIILKSRMNDSSLIRIHRFKGYRSLGSLNLIGNVLSQGLQGFLPSLTVILSIQLHPEISFCSLVHNQAHQILERIQGLPPLANEDPHVLAFQV